MTLVEMVVVLAILGVAATVVGLAIQRAVPARAVSQLDARVAAARDSAIRVRHPVTLLVPPSATDPSSVAAEITAMPDGAVVGIPFSEGGGNAPLRRVTNALP